ncbi:MAG: D-alanyl-D-alanine carboxypeptidase family protein [Minisyncoccales bacterium]|jgi:D-alanyl-D-alanine carboxypeptidase
MAKRTKKKIDKSSLLKFTTIALSIITIALVTLLVFELKRSNEIANKEVEPIISFYQSFLPLRKWEISSPDVKAQSAVAVLIEDGNRKFLFEKNSKVSLPIASITKLMTVLVAMEEYQLDDQLVVSENAFLKGVLGPNSIYPAERYSVKDLIYASLIESNNAAAQTLAENMTSFEQYQSDSLFVSKMNKKAIDLGMTHTYFSNPSGLDPEDGFEINRSSPEDLVILVEYLLEKPVVWEALLTERYDLRTADGLFKSTIINTNELLNKRDDIKGGKTGNTPRAGRNFLAVFEVDGKTIVTIVFNSPSRFNDTNLMLNWIEEAYYWKKI